MSCVPAVAPQSHQDCHYEYKYQPDKVDLLHIANKHTMTDTTIPFLATPLTVKHSQHPFLVHLKHTRTDSALHG